MVLYDDTFNCVTVPHADAVPVSVAAGGFDVLCSV
jgi:hypothetical protein|tara:strand:+ start:8453 stop:8557 length:105 start_codon:yes stop_codon:yes gene_type:complete